MTVDHPSVWTAQADVVPSLKVLWSMIVWDFISDSWASDQKEHKWAQVIMF